MADGLRESLRWALSHINDDEAAWANQSAELAAAKARAEGQTERTE